MITQPPDHMFADALLLALARAFHWLWLARRVLQARMAEPDAPVEALARAGGEGAMRQIGDRVFVTADNFGSPAVIIDVRESDGSPASHYKVRTDDGDEFWVFDFEISEVE